MTASKGERLRFRPTLRATAIALSALVTLLALGTWQLERLASRTELIAHRQSQLAVPPMPLAAVPAGDPGAPAALEFRRVRARGVFLHVREIHLAATRRGKVGFRVVTPLRRADGTTLLVDRGWVPAAARDPARRAEGQVAGKVEVEGVLRGGGRRGWFTPDNDPAGNYWFWRDLPAMAAAAGVEAPAIVLEAGPAANPGGLPIGSEIVADPPNNHLGYAVTWYSLAAALVAIYVLSQRTSRAARD